MIPLLLIDELPSCKWQDKLTDQLVVWRCSISPKYPKLEAGEGINFVLTRIQHFFIQTRPSEQIWLTHLGNEEEKKKAFSLNCIFCHAKHFLSSSPQHTHIVGAPLVYFSYFMKNAWWGAAAGSCHLPAIPQPGRGGCALTLIQTFQRLLLQIKVHLEKQNDKSKLSESNLVTVFRVDPYSHCNSLSVWQ